MPYGVSSVLVWVSATVNVNSVILNKSINLPAVHFLLVPKVGLCFHIGILWELSCVINDYPSFSDVIILKKCPQNIVLPLSMFFGSEASYSGIKS